MIITESLDNKPAAVTLEPLGDGDPSIKHIVETCESLPVHSGEMEVNT